MIATTIVMIIFIIISIMNYISKFLNNTEYHIFPYHAESYTSQGS